MVESGPFSVGQEAAAELGALKAGELFAGRYRIDDVLGRGAMGIVWSALDEEVGDRVALKVLTAGPADAIERFRREVRLARKVTHRNAARIFDLGSDGNLLYLTMELIEGESLADLLTREGRLATGRGCDIAAQVATGLAAAHDVGVVHRDIKPANVLLETTGRVVLTDFGVARALASDAQLTLASAMIGTPSYMAPEQVRGESVGPATDLYALGAMLYEILAGQPPFVRDTAMATAISRLETDPEDPRKWAAVPDVVAELILQCLERLPERRPTSAAQTAAVLTGISQTEQPGVAETLFQPSAGSTVAGTTGTGSPSGPVGATGSGSTFVSLSREERSLAVLPFRHRGPSEHAYIAETVAEDLVDVLTTMSGLRVASSGATAKYEGKSVDPREAGTELGANAIIDATSRIQGERFRLSARLVDVATGEQLWVNRLDTPLTEVVESPEFTAQRIAESLRQELELLSERRGVPEAAVALYLEARHQIIGTARGDSRQFDALDRLERAITIAPEFSLAMALHADISVRLWFLPLQQDDDPVAQRARDSVARALEKASDLALTHFAAARLAVNDGGFDVAAQALTLALSIAPTYAAVHHYLGNLQCEAGRGDEGERHLDIALKIDPSLPIDGTLARRAALAGDLDKYQESINEMRASQSTSRFLLESLQMRVAGWFGDLETVRRCDPSASVPADSVGYPFFMTQYQGLLGEATAQQLLGRMDEVVDSGAGPRLIAFLRQLTIESLTALGEPDTALEQLRMTAEDAAFVDADWMERCPALDSLRDHPEFGQLTALVRQRADAIWRIQTV